jgi:hypothetical protein
LLFERRDDLVELLILFGIVAFVPPDRQVGGGNRRSEKAIKLAIARPNSMRRMLTSSLLVDPSIAIVPAS